MNSDYKELQAALISNNLDEFIRETKHLDINSVSDLTKMNILHYYISKSSSLNYNPNEVINYLLKERGLRINEQDKEGLSAVYHSVANKRDDILKILIRSNANIELADNDGCTPLFRAIHSFRGEKKILEIIFLLLNNGSSLECKNKMGISPKHLIIQRGKSIDLNLNPKEWDLQTHLKDF